MIECVSQNLKRNQSYHLMALSLLDVLFCCSVIFEITFSLSLLRSNERREGPKQLKKQFLRLE